MGAESQNSRFYELDWLRVFAVLVLVFFHSSEIFNFGWFHIKNSESSRFFNYFSSFIHIWHMPLFFLISGASAWFALNFRSKAAYRNERFYRLFIPLVFGILILIPPQSYLENSHKSGYTGSFFEFYPHFFEGIYPSGNLHWGHLWFLFYLFVFSLVSLRLFAYLKSDRSKEWLQRFVNRFSGGRSIFLLMTPLVIIEIALRWLFPGFQTFVTDWANVFHYLLLFIYGFLLFSDDRFRQTIAFNKRLALLITLPFSVAYVLIIPLSESAFEGFMENPSAQYLITYPETIGYYILMMVFQIVAEWCWLIAFLGYSRRYFSAFKGWGIDYLSKMALPFYIFHQTVVLTLGFYIIQSTISIGLKYTIISLFSIPLVVLCCVIANSNRVTRFMFGIK